MTIARGKLQRRIVQELALRGGMTANELADLLEEDILRLRPRLWDLRKTGRIGVSKSKRRYGPHRNAYVFVATPFHELPKPVRKRPKKRKGKKKSSRRGLLR